jgi:hypothetical protein
MDPASAERGNSEAAATAIAPDLINVLRDVFIIVSFN